MPTRQHMIHKHVAISIHFRGKADSLELECFCGETEVWAEWYENGLPGWNITGEMSSALRTLMMAWPSALDDGASGDHDLEQQSGLVQDQPIGVSQFLFGVGLMTALHLRCGAHEMRIDRSNFYDAFVSTAERANLISSELSLANAEGIYRDPMLNVVVAADNALLDAQDMGVIVVTSQQPVHLHFLHAREVDDGFLGELSMQTWFFALADYFLEVVKK